MRYLDDFQNLDLLYESDSSLIYRGLLKESGQPVILKILNKEYPSATETAAFREEYKLASRFNEEGVIQVYEMSTVNGSLAIIMEDIGARSIVDTLKSTKLDLVEFLSLAERISTIVGNIHKRNIIHKDINPTNIVWNIEKDIVGIIDFGIATELPWETTSVKNPNVLEGTLAYISPEQTGRMNRSLDYRTDFYSLGATLYWILTGALPFESDDMMGLIHSHIAVQPAPPHEIDESIPLPVSGIIMKSMAKNAEDRYLSAHGLVADIRFCLSELRKKGAISDFVLGRQDVSDKFQINQKLIGREEHLNALVGSFERVVEGSSELIMVSGVSGIGKSRLINEMHKPVVKHRGYFVVGKFERLRKDIPYSGFIQAFTGLADQILAEDESEIVKWKEKIMSVLGTNGKIITDLIPTFELIIGEQPEIPAVKPVESQNRFNLVIKDFVKALAIREHPLVLFLDDLQWADLASLHLLQLFASDSDIGYLLMIGAYRHSETSNSHPLILTLDEIKKFNGNVNDVHLGPLTFEQISQVLCNTLKITNEQSQPLAALLNQKTRGNPFFINEFLESLYKKQLIEFSFERGWSWNIKGITKMEATDNVIDLLIGRIVDLPEDSQEILKRSSCIGGRFNLGTLAEVCGQSAEYLLSTLKKPLQEGMLLLIDNNYQFSHDRIREAAYSLIPNEEKTRLHLLIGKLELDKTDEKSLPDKIFYIVNHYNAGIERVETKVEKFELAKLNLAAGKKALSSNAYASAIHYLKTGIGLLDEKCWQEAYNEALELYQEGTVASQLIADYQLMDELAEVVVENARSILDRIKIYETKIFACVARNNPWEGIMIGRQVLRQLGIKLPKKPSVLKIIFELQLVKMPMLGKSVEDLINLPVMDNPYKLAAMRILSGMSTSVYLVAPNLLPLLVFNMVKLSIKYGNSNYSPYAYAAFGMIHCGVLSDVESGYKLGELALNLAEKFDIKENKSRVWLVVWFFINHWKRPIDESVGSLIESYKTGLETGDLEFAAISAGAYSLNLFNSGIELSEIEKETAKYTEAIRKLNQDSVLEYHLIFEQTVLNLRGLNEDPCQLIGSSYDADKMLPKIEKSENKYVIFYHYYYLTILNYLLENERSALQYAEKAKSNIINAHLAQPVIPVFNFYYSLSLLSQCPAEKNSNRKKYLNIVLQNQKKMGQWARLAPMNYNHKYHLVEAEKARILGQRLKAMDHYKQSVALSHENRFLREKALALKLTAKFWLDLNEAKIAALYMTEAVRTYEMWGGKAAASHLYDTYGALLASSSDRNKPISSTLTGSKRGFGSSQRHFISTEDENSTHSDTYSTEESLHTINPGSKEMLDMSAVTKASQAISSEIDLKKLLGKIMKIIMENAGADKGYFILKKEKELLIEAAADASKKDIRVLNSIRVEDSGELSKTIVNYVLRTTKSIVLPNDKDDKLFINDPYLNQNKPKSVLCIPMRYMDKTTGILYLENSITANAFTKQRIETLNILLSQAVISLEHAFVYQNLDELVKERTAQLLSVQAELIENAHKAGMADIASGTLHNIGNILNSVKISTQFIKKAYNLSSFFADFKKANQLVRANLDSIEEFIISNPKGKMLFQYFLMLEEKMESELSNVRSQIDRLTDKVDVMVDVVSAQQSYATAAPLTESVSLSAIIEDALTMLQESLDRHKITIVRDFSDNQEVCIQKTKLIHIIINIAKNSQEAMSGMPVEKKRITFKVYSNGDNAYISVEDSGKGILPENLKKVFNHGFTTKKEGHGFGLHSCANYMADMEGRMWAESEGEGKGAKFILEFPMIKN